jgi:hypothetical protein
MWQRFLPIVQEVPWLSSLLVEVEMLVESVLMKDN